MRKIGEKSIANEESENAGMSFFLFFTPLEKIQAIVLDHCSKKKQEHLSSAGWPVSSQPEQILPAQQSFSAQNLFVAQEARSDDFAFTSF
jgi:hypothetical protein